MNSFHNTPETSSEGYEAIKIYGTDLVDRARAGNPDPVIGRDEEIRNVIRILSRKTKNNPVLIGEPGVGKTAIAEGLAQRHRARRRARRAAQQDHFLARHGRSDCGREIPWRI